MINLLQTRPHIGFLSSTGGVTLMSITEIVTSDVTARLLSVTGASLGILVAILTVVAKAIEIRKSLIKRNGKV